MQSTNKKVCIVTISLAKGGAERSCAILSEMLSNLGYEVHLVLLNDAIDYPYQGEIFNLGALKDGNDNFFKRWKRLSLLRKYLKKNNFDCIIDHRPKNNYKREWLYHKRVYRNQKVIYVAHSSKKEEYVTENPAKFAKICNRNVMNVAVSKYIETEVLQASGIQNTATIHNAFNPEWNTESSELPEELSGKEYILSYGRMVDDIKDFRFLIEAYEASDLAVRGVHLVLMGDGPDKGSLEQFASGTRSKDYIVFLPFNPAPFRVIQNAKFVTLTSFYEGFPMVLVESLSVGTPVVSLDITSGPNEIVQHEENGLLVSERNIPLFAAAMERMITDSDLYNRCMRNAKPSVSQFSVSEIGRKWDLILQDV